MATTNGVVTPPAALAPRETSNVVDKVDGHKRKRSDDEDEAATAVVGLSLPASKKSQIQRDILEVLRQHDTHPSFLEHPLDKTLPPSLKKVRMSNTTQGSESIRSKLDAGVYSSLSELRRDAENTGRELLETIRAGANKEREGPNAGRLTVDDLKQIQRVKYLAQAIEDLVEQGSTAGTLQDDTMEGSKDLPMTNGKLEDQQANLRQQGNTVLTLFGNGPTPRQLFSSRQNVTGAETGNILKTDFPVEELGLPNGLSATNIKTSLTADCKTGPTFEEAFPPPYNLPALQPPKPHRRPATRDANIAWEFKDVWSKANKKGGYTVQPLTVGDWLGYGGVDSREDVTSPREKRKLRDRALSSGETSMRPPSQASLDESLAREEEALFRRAYSSFAPSCDNTRAFVSEETKSMVWWHKVGRHRYNEIFAIDPALMDEKPMNPYGDFATVEDQQSSDEDFGPAVEAFTNIDDDLPGGKIEISRDYTDVDDVLRQISNLLATLASHQRIRNASLPPATTVSRASISPAPALASRIGTPDSPAEDEIATYEALRREIAYLVLKLPPYAVAKLDGDQLSELGVSRLITFESKDVKGTMEEDQVARQARQTAMATAAGIASLTRSQSGSSGQHYSSTNQRAPAIGQAANTRYGGLYSVSRSPLNQPQYQRSGGNQTSYATPTASGPRSGHPASSQQRQGYVPPNGQQYYQRPGQQSAGGYAGYPQQYQSTSHAQQHSTYSQPLATFTNQRAQNAVRYQMNDQASQSQSPAPWTVPPKPVYTTQNPQPIAQRPNSLQQQQPGSGRASPTSLPSQPNTPVNGGQRPAPPVARQPSASATPQPPLRPQTQPNGHA